MAQDTSGPDPQRLEALAKQIEAAERQELSLVAAIDRAATVRMLLTLVVLAVVVTYVVLFYRAGKSFTEARFVGDLGDQLKRRAVANQDELVREARALQEHTMPVVTAAFNKQFKSDMPRYQAKMGEEWKEMQKSLPTKFEKLMEEQYKKTLTRHRDVLKQEFPDVKEREIQLMTENFQLALKPLVAKYYGDRMRAQLETMYSTWQDFPAAEMTGTPDEMADQLYEHIVGFLLERISRSAEETDRVRPAAGSGSGL